MSEQAYHSLIVYFIVNINYTKYKKGGGISK